MFYGRSTYADKELLPTDDEGSGVETQGGEGLCYGTGHLYGGSRTKTVSVSQWDDVGSLMPGIIYIQCPAQTACTPSSVVVVVPKYENMNPPLVCVQTFVHI